ncbi:hypothetical protein [Candidatus Palauibacter sp.]|uniref:hypothetical protein n=1 Tax=Candidatus Palauibacter sp. TaxID=3101350 RepID=UPI003B025815
MSRIGRSRVGLAGFAAVVAMAVSQGAVQAQESWLVGAWEATGMPAVITGTFSGARAEGEGPGR